MGSVWGAMGLMLLAGASGTPQETPHPFPIQTLARGTSSGVRERLVTVIKTEEAWRALWQRHIVGVEPRPAPPPVDFSREMVVAVFMGEQRTSGATVEVLEATRQEGAIVVRVREVSPPPEGIVLPVLTQPFHLVALPRSELPVRFEWR